MRLPIPVLQRMQYSGKYSQNIIKIPLQVSEKFSENYYGNTKVQVPVINYRVNTATVPYISSDTGTGSNNPKNVIPVPVTVPVPVCTSIGVTEYPIRLPVPVTSS